MFIIYNSCIWSIGHVFKGIGIVSPLGCTTDYAWHQLIEGKCGVSKHVIDTVDDIPCQVAASVPRGIMLLLH